MRAPRLAGGKLVRLLQALGGIDALLSGGRAELERAGLEPDTVQALLRPDERLLAADQAWLDLPGHALITWDSERYPALLRDIPYAPAALFTDGDADLLWQPQLAIVGSRNPTAGGVENARAFSFALARQGLAITSGLASGIDSAAHQGALDAGRATIAVTGTGLDRVYPARNRALAERIRANGVLVSEFPPGTEARRANFPARNRIISGLSLGVLVVEAALNSGSLITARLAAEQGREVFALPGSIHNPLSKGCHRLIREGVKLVETDQEILQELAPLAARLAGSLRAELATAAAPELGNAGARPKFEADADYRRLWNCLAHDPLPFDSLVRMSGLTAQAVSAMLLMLELQGEVEAHPGGAYSRTTRGR